MPDLRFLVEGAEALAHAAAPTLIFKLRIDNADPRQTIHSILLRCQIQIEAPQRRYQPQEQQWLVDLFGEPSRWDRTLRNLLWTHTSATVTSFSDSTIVDLLVPCTFDFNVAVTKYFHALEGGEVPLRLLFSGTVFYATEAGELQAVPIPWEKEARFRMPVKAWKDVVDHYYPNSAWLCLQRDAFDRLYQYKLSQGCQTWEQALDRLLAEKESSVSP
jgi:hypothetical protein